MKIQNTGDYTLNKVKALVYGGAGIGKTRLCATAPNPIILSAESGLLSLRKENLPAIIIKTMDDLYEVYDWLTGSEEAKSYETVCLDSISEIAEAILAAEKELNADPRKAYLNMQEKTESLIKAFRDLNDYNVYFSCKMERITTDTGAVLYAPSFPGRNLAQNVSYLFDEVFAMVAFTDEKNNTSRWLQTGTDAKYMCKDRSGALDMYVEPNLTAIFNKINA